MKKEVWWYRLPWDILLLGLQALHADKISEVERLGGFLLIGPLPTVMGSTFPGSKTKMTPLTQNQPS